MNISVALLSALVFLPPMLVWADQRRWVTRGVLHKTAHLSKVEGERAPAPAS